MGLSVWQILIVVLLLVLLFGRGKISELMGDMAKGIKSFKKGMAEDPDEAPKVAERHDQTIDVTPSKAEQGKDNA
ncbi:MAG: twin-arginine translocase TatA/TatE family subunit [Thermohalobaculum sp.]|nr:twin-arginine translocase TatA/TatE family subunit [Thermohalobaculum sp.]